LAATVIATTSRWENAWIAGHFRLPSAVRRNMRLSPLGIAADLYGQRFTETQLADFRARHGLEPGYVSQVARIEEKKNQLAVIQALYDDPIPLVFVGQDSPYYAVDYPGRCRALGARRGRVKFLGWLPEAELPLLYAAGAAHIMASWVELPGLSSLEAGASGSRVISTAIAPLPELLGETLWCCDPYDLASIRTATLGALAAPVPAGLRERLLAEFSWPAVAAANLALYEETLRLHRSHRR
jgi:glycosyltransferase involved in cell wall biosynthesis